MLETEKQAYEKMKPELLRKAEGKYALIIGDQLAGIFDTEGAAYEAGVAKYGNIPMLIQQVGQGDVTATIPALTLGLLRANL